MEKANYGEILFCKSNYGEVQFTYFKDFPSDIPLLLIVLAGSKLKCSLRKGEK